jgi:hypothetical protein
MTNEAINKQLAKAQAEADKEQSRDLVLILANDGDIYRQSIKPVIANLQKKIKKGNFDETQAIQSFYNIVLSALKNPTFNRYYSYNIKMVDVPTRYYTAVELAEHFEDELFTIE